MELRCYNVTDIWYECVKCRIDDTIGIDKEKFEKRIPDIVSMVEQIKTDNGCIPCCECHIRKDGEQWTPFRQTIEMLLLLAEKAGAVSFERPLVNNPLIVFKNGKE